MPEIGRERERRYYTSRSRQRPSQESCASAPEASGTGAAVPNTGYGTTPTGFPHRRCGSLAGSHTASLDSEEIRCKHRIPGRRPTTCTPALWIEQLLPPESGRSLGSSLALLTALFNFGCRAGACYVCSSASTGRTRHNIGLSQWRIQQGAANPPPRHFYENLQKTVLQQLLQ